MSRRNRKLLRNTLDLNDRIQVRIVKRRLGISEPDLNALVNRVGNSIACLSKEVALQRAKSMNTPANVPTAVVIDATARAEAAGAVD